MSDIIISYSADSIESDLLKLDRTFNKTESCREALLEKFTPIVMDMNINTNVSDRDGASALEAQLSVVSTYMSLLNDTDKAIKTKIDVKSKREENVVNNNLSEMVINTIREATRNRMENKKKSSVAVSRADTALDMRALEESIVLTEGELREDPNDIS